MNVRVELSDAATVNDLRRRVLRPDLPADSDMSAMGVPGCLTLAAFEADGRVVGTCVIYPAPYPLRPGTSGAWQLRGMATDPDVRGSGVGVAVLARAQHEAVGHGARLLWCNARLTAIGFYERSGWTPQGAVFHSPETDLPHRCMWWEPDPPLISSE